MDLFVFQTVPSKNDQKKIRVDAAFVDLIHDDMGDVRQIAIELNTSKDYTGRTEQQASIGTGLFLVSNLVATYCETKLDVISHTLLGRYIGKKQNKTKN